MSHDDLASMGYPPSTPSHEEMVSARNFDGHSTQKQNNGVQRVGRSHVGAHADRRGAATSLGADDCACVIE